MKNKILNFLIYAWVIGMIIIIFVAVGKVLWEEPVAWIGVVIVLIVLILTRNVNLITLYKSKEPKTRKKNERRNNRT